MAVTAWDAAPVIRHLPRVVPAAPGRDPGAGADHPMRRVTERVAADPTSWDAGLRAEVTTLFDELAGEWHTRSSPHRHEPLVDALTRGGPFAGPVLEVGSGVGLATGVLERLVGETVVALDVSWEMLRRAPVDIGARVQADASRLPVPAGSLGLVVLENTLLFGPEVDAALAPGGAVAWVNSNGDRTPIHLPAEAVADALPGAWDGVASEAGWGTWCVLRRSGEGTRTGAGGRPT